MLRDGITLAIDDLHELDSPKALTQLTRLLVNLCHMRMRCWAWCATTCGWACISCAWQAS